MRIAGSTIAAISGALAGIDRQEVDHRAGDAGRVGLRRSSSITVDRQSCAFSAARIARIRRPHPGAADRPVAAQPLAHQVVEIDRLMRAVEIAEADMDDARTSGRRGRSPGRSTPAGSAPRTAFDSFSRGMVLSLIGSPAPSHRSGAAGPGIGVSPTRSPWCRSTSPSAAHGQGADGVGDRHAGRCRSRDVPRPRRAPRKVPPSRDRVTCSGRMPMVGGVAASRLRRR